METGGQEAVGGRGRSTPVAVAAAPPSGTHGGLKSQAQRMAPIRDVEQRLWKLDEIEVSGKRKKLKDLNGKILFIKGQSQGQSHEQSDLVTRANNEIELGKLAFFLFQNLVLNYHQKKRKREEARLEIRERTTSKGPDPKGCRVISYS